MEQEPGTYRAETAPAAPAAPAPRGWLAYGDPLRIAGAVAVVVLHVTSDAVASFGKPTVPRLDWWLCLAARCLCVWAVPVFIMLSGALLLDPEREEPYGAFYRKRFTRIGLPLVFWSAFYLLWQVYYQGRQFLWDNPQRLPHVLTPWNAVGQVAMGTTYAHLYFLYILAGVYLFTPLLRRFVRHSTRREQLLFVVLGLALGCADKWARSQFGGAPTGFLMFAPFAGFFGAGYWLRGVRLNREGRVVVWAVFLAMVAVAMGATRYLFGLHGKVDRAAYAMEFLSPHVIVMSLAAFLLFADLFSRVPRHAVVRWLANATLGIYLIHPAILAMMRDGHYPWPWSPVHPELTPLWHGALVGLPFCTAVAFVASLLLTSVLMAIPGVRRVVA